MLKRFLFVLLLFGFVISVPYEVSAAPKKETRKERRERLKREQEERKRQQTQPKNIQQRQTSQTTQQQPPKQQSQTNVVPKPNSGNPQKTLHALIEKLQKNDKISSEYKQIIITSLTELSKTQTGRYIFSNIPDDITFIVDYGIAPGSYGSKKLRITPSLFKNMLAKDSIAEKERVYFRITDLIAHELTHATQRHLGICSLANFSLEDRVTLRKFREMHALLEQECAKTELLESPSFRNYKAELEKTGKIDTFFILKAKKEQINIGISPEKAQRFARTEFVRSYWSNTPNTSVRIGSKNLTIDEADTRSWNSYYNNVYSSVVNHEDYKKVNKRDIRPELKEALDIIGLDLTPEFIIRNKSFDLEKGRFVGYLNGVKNQEIDALGKGRVVKSFIRSCLHTLKIEMPNKENKSYKEYFHDTKTLKATYTIENNEKTGVYREYDRKGQQIIEVPVNNNGELEGIGWVLENDEVVKKEFRGGFVLKKRRQ